MSITPADLLSIANRLADGETDEASARSSVSRSYYAALHACMNGLPETLRPPAESSYQKGSHRAIIDAMERWGKSSALGRGEAAVAARYLAKLKRQRVVADYRIYGPWTADAVACISDAKRVIELVAVASEQYVQLG